MAKNKKIQDNPSYAKMREEMKGFSTLSNFIGLFGLGGKQWKEVKKQFPELKNQLEELSTTPDKFNEYYAQRGWVAHESINFDSMKKAVKFAESGKIEEGEEVLIDQYSPENMKFKIHWLKNEDAFEIRYDLILKAFDDYKEERYHSCVPLVLMLTDGAVNDITKSKGFFAEGTEVTAWDSIAGHSSGLNVLKDIFTVGRNKTSKEKISIPYRNGILHGRDLGYANKKVAAKAWAAMFAIRDWAVALRKNGKQPQEPESKSGFIDTDSLEIEEQIHIRRLCNQYLDTNKLRLYSNIIPLYAYPVGIRKHKQQNGASFFVVYRVVQRREFLANIITEL